MLGAAKVLVFMLFVVVVCGHSFSREDEGTKEYMKELDDGLDGGTALVDTVPAISDEELEEDAEEDRLDDMDLLDDGMEDEMFEEEMAREYGD